MMDKKISALTAATTPLAGTETLPVVQGAATVKVPVSSLTAGRQVDMLSANVGIGAMLTNTRMTLGNNTGAPAQANLAAGFGLYKFAQSDNPFTIDQQDSYAAIVAMDNASGIYSKELRGSKTQRVAAVVSVVVSNAEDQLMRFS